MEIDLHGKTTEEAISFFIDSYNKVLKNKQIKSIYVIHGYGSTGKGGKIKKVFHSFLRENTYYLKYDFDSNPGATIVYLKQKLPNKLSFLEKDILDYCSLTPKSLSKIESNFFNKSNVPDIKKSINSLVKKELLIKIMKKNTNIYQKKGE
jgi:hypothetical protein